MFTLPGEENHGQRGLADCSSWDLKEVDNIEQLTQHIHTLPNHLIIAPSNIKQEVSFFRLGSFFILVIMALVSAEDNCYNNPSGIFPVH